jgi:hypothetical protein
VWPCLNLVAATSGPLAGPNLEKGVALMPADAIGRRRPFS